MLPQLQECFEHTEWDVFEQQDFEGHTETVLSYTRFCTDIVTVEKLAIQEHQVR